MLSVVAGGFPNDKFTGKREFDVWRACTLVSILARGGEFKTKLNKLLFYADFCAYRTLHVSISGFRYARISYGPVPKDYDALYASFAQMGVVSIEPCVRHGLQGEVISSKAEPPPDMLSAEEVSIAEKVKDHFRGWTASETRTYSHKERAWKEVSTGSLIAYDYADKLNLKIDP